MLMMKRSIIRSAVLLLLSICLLLSGISIASADEKPKKEINMAGITLLTYTPYTVYLEPAETCTPSFEPTYVTMEFHSVNSCTLTYRGESVSMGRLDNKRDIDLFSLSSEMSEQLIFGGKCDTDCTGADFAVRVTSFIQAEDAPPVFSADAILPESWAPSLDPIAPEEPVTFRANDQTLILNERYSFLITPDESCDKEFDPFIIPIQFFSELGGYFVTSQYKNVSSVYPFSLYIEDSGWVELRAGRGKVWGLICAGSEDAEFTLRVVGMENESTIANLFKNVTYRKGREPKPEPAPLPIGNYDPEFYFYYGTLNEGEKSVYTQLVQALTACEETLTLAYPVTNSNLNRIFWCVLNDQPQIFWTNRSYRSLGYTADSLVTKVQLSYNSLARNLAVEQSRVENAVARILSGAKGMSALEAERYVHDLLIKETSYNAESPNNQNIYSILVSKETVCAGYSRAFQYLMQRLGIPCYYVGGNVPDQGSIYEGRHAWNLVKVNGDWYNVDVTWDDYYKEKNKRYSCISYEFYNVTDSFISGEHTRNEDSIQMPPCTSTRASFDRLYGHNWQTEVAIAGGIPAVSSLNEYFSLCANSLKGAGIGDISCRFIVTNQATMNRIQEQSTTKEYENAYVYPFFNTSNLRNVTYYYSWQGAGLSSRGNCYYIDLTHTIKRK